MARCHLLSLEPELRNTIFEMALSIDPDIISYTDLSEAAPPSINLLRTCRQVYHEAKGFYASACRRYWTETRFKINSYHEDVEEFQSQHTASLQDQEIKMIRHLRVRNVEGGEVDVLLDVRGGWLADGSRSNVAGQPYIRIRPWHPSEGERDLEWEGCPSFDKFATEDELMHALATHGHAVSFTDQIRFMVENYF